MRARSLLLFVCLFVPTTSAAFVACGGGEADVTDGGGTNAGGDGSDNGGDATLGGDGGDDVTLGGDGGPGGSDGSRNDGTTPTGVDGGLPSNPGRVTCGATSCAADA